MIARFIVTEPRIGQHSGICGVCGQHSDQAWARTEILQKTTSNTTVTFPFNTDAICEYCVVMWECGRANPWNRGLLAIVADGEKMTHRQILMAGVKMLLERSVAEVLPPGGIEKLKSL